MARESKAEPEPQAPAVLPDVAAQPHPQGHAQLPAGEAGEGHLQSVLPEISEVAQKVGGYKKLAEIADTLDGMGK
jgi:hypothetical protein